jgi:hypothetical protein
MGKRIELVKRNTWDLEAKSVLLGRSIKKGNRRARASLSSWFVGQNR